MQPFTAYALDGCLPISFQGFFGLFFGFGILSCFSNGSISYYPVSTAIYLISSESD